MLARKSCSPASGWRPARRSITAITRGLFRFTDREGGGPRLVRDAPLHRRAAQEPIRRCATRGRAFPDRRAGTGLYAFVEAAPGLSERELRDFVARSQPHAEAAGASAGGRGIAAPRKGEVRSEILQLVAMNQVDLIDPAGRRTNRAQR